MWDCMTTIGEVHIVLWVFTGHGPNQRKVGTETKKVTSELSLKGYRFQRLNLKKVISTARGLPKRPYYKAL